MVHVWLFVHRATAQTQRLFLEETTHERDNDKIWKFKSLTYFQLIFVCFKWCALCENGNVRLSVCVCMRKGLLADNTRTTISRPINREERHFATGEKR